MTITKDEIRKRFKRGQYISGETATKDLLTPDYATQQYPAGETTTKDLLTPDYATQQYTIVGKTTDKGVRRGVKRSQYASGTAISKDLLTPDYTTQQYVPGETTDKESIRRGFKRSKYASGTAINKDLLTPDYTTQQYIPKEYATQEITSNQLTIDGQITNKMITKDDNIYDINRLLQRIPTSEQNIIPGAPTDLTSTFNQVYEERASSFNVEGPKPVVPTMTKPTFGQETTSDNLLYPGVGKIGIKDNKYYEKYGFLQSL